MKRRILIQVFRKQLHNLFKNQNLISSNMNVTKTTLNVMQVYVIFLMIYKNKQNKKNKNFN
jgi:hypothetical protein